jgi:predicted esterase
MREHHLEIPRTARYFCSGAPETDARELWVVCHGYAQLASRFLRHFEPIAGEGRLIAAPEGLSRFYVDSPRGHHGADARIGATWMTREDRLAEIADHVRYLDLLVEELTRRRGAPFPRITALGFSQGVATVSRWLALGATHADHVILWGGTLPTDVSPDHAGRIFDGARLTIVMGEADPLMESDRVTAELEKLDGAGVRYELVRFGGRHEVDGDVLRDLAKR